MRRNMRCLDDFPLDLGSFILLLVDLEEFVVKWQSSLFLQFSDN